MGVLHHVRSHIPNAVLTNSILKEAHRITATHYFLFKCGLKETELCTFCTETKEILLHLILGMHLPKESWFSLVNILESCGLNMQ